MASKKYVIMTDGTYKAVGDDGSLENESTSGGVIAADQNFVSKVNRKREENYATFNDFSAFGFSFGDTSDPNNVKGYAFKDENGALLSDAHGFEGGAKNNPNEQLSYHLDYNSSVRNSRFAPDYQLDGMAGSSAVSSVFTRENEETINVIFELFTLISETLIVATSLHAVTGLAIATDRSISSSKKLGRYRNYSDVGYVKYLVEKLNFPVDLIVNDYQNHRLGTTDIEKSKNPFSEFVLSFFYVNAYLMVGLGEYFFPGNFISDRFDNFLLHKVFKLNYNKNAKDGLLEVFTNTLNLIVEGLLSEDSYYNILKLTIRKMQGSEQYIANKETTNGNYNFNDEDPAAKFFHLATKSYLTKFTIERINAGKQVFNIMAFSNLLESDNPFGGKNQEAIKIYPHKIAEGANKGYTYTSIKNTENLLLEFNKLNREYLRRFTNKEAKKVEDTLKDSQYVPFYIRDLRSNEIIHMHSFIESFTDSISAQYNETGGFGRVDKIKRWESTTRSINIGFYMVATQPEDHDLMWLKINKIANMLYPQWSDSVGRVTRTDDSKKYFKFPFTSVPTATPLVRIKLGDVLTSNHSEVNIRRIHGEKSITATDNRFDENAVEGQTVESGKTKYNNPILAAYMTTQGDGLAGVIDSFNVDFSNDLPWETKQGSAAPIYTKITLGFKPIHDIPPGMSHDGYMRAPIYRVGGKIIKEHY